MWWNKSNSKEMADVKMNIYLMLIEFYYPEYFVTL